MQYCSLEQRTLLLSPVTSITGCCFCFGSIPSFFLKLEQVTSPELRLSRLCAQVHLASVLFSWDKYPDWRLCSCPGTWPPQQITTFELNSEHPSMQAELSPMCLQMQPFWGMRGVQPPSWFPVISPCLFGSAPFRLLSVICMLACLTTLTLWAVISVTEARTLGHCTPLSLQHCQSLTQEKYYLPLTFLLSRGQHPWNVYETGPVDSNIVFLLTSCSS